MNCPNCELINPPTARRCDCGYDFESRTIKTPYVRQEAPAPSRWGRWASWFLGWTVLRVLFSAPHEAGMWLLAIILCGGFGYAFFRLKQTQSANLAMGKVMNELVIEEAAPAQEPVARPNTGDEFFNYYLDPHPERAPEALRDCIEKGVFNDPENVVWYLFVRIARDNPWLVRHYEALFREKPAGRPVLLSILQQVGDEETRRFLEDCIGNPEFEPLRTGLETAVQDWPAVAIDPLARPVSSRADLDLLWCEFRATGSTEPVLRIIDVFERPDRIRIKLEDWLHEAPPEGRASRILWALRRKRLVRRLRVEASI